MISAQKISIEEKKIQAVKVWPKPKSIIDIQILLGFANFYQCFIQGYSKIATLFTSILKTIAGTPF